MTAPIDSDCCVVDSSGWIEFLGGGAKADAFAVYLSSVANTVFLPSLVVYEVYMKLLRERGKPFADEFQSQAFGFGENFIPLTLQLSISAARLSLETGLAMADAIIYATARKQNAQLITADSHFRDLDGVTIL